MPPWGGRLARSPTLKMNLPKDKSTEAGKGEGIDGGKEWHSM